MEAVVGTPKTDSNKEFPSLDSVLGNTPTPLKMAALKSASSLEFAKLLKTGSITKKVNFRAVEVPSCEGADATIPMSSVLEVNERLGNTVYGYFLGKRVAFHQLEIWKRCWRMVLGLFKKWTPNLDAYKDELTTVPVWVKFHYVPIPAFKADGLSVIATKLGTPLMLDSYTGSICTESRGRSGYTWAMIELRTDLEFKESMVVLKRSQAHFFKSFTL
ncbi:hypothetical protein Tco_0963043 [Tanacetum coccineum]